LTNWGESRNIHRIMKRSGIVWILFSVVLTAAAQTDTNAVSAPTDTNEPTAPPVANKVVVQTDTNVIAATAGTNVLALQAETNTVVAPAGTNAAVVQTATNAPGANPGASREMSLQDCIQEALQHNFDLQIQRYTPQLSLYNLRADYGGYDPTFNISGLHDWNSGPLQTNGFTTTTLTSTNFAFFPREPLDKNIFNSDIGGSTPWGLNYDFVANLEQDYGTIYSGTTNQVSSFNRNTYGSIEADLTQHLLKNFWIDSTRLTIRVAKNRLKYSEQSLRQQFITTVTAVENAYYELIYALENVKVQQEALELAQTQLDQDNQRVQIGTLAILDVQQDEAQVAQSRANLIAAQYTLVTDQNTLKNLLTDQYSRWHDTDIQPEATLTAPPQSFDLQESWKKGMSGRPDLVQARLDVERQGIQLKFDRNQLFPSLDLVGTYGYNGGSRDYDGTFDEIGRGDQPYYSYGVKLSLPLSNVSARNNLKADKVSEKQLLLTLKQLEQTIMVEIDNAIKRAQSAYQSVDATRQARVYAEAALDAEQKKYAVGKSTTFTVLQLQNTLTADRGLEIRALANYNEALVNLAAQEGSTLERDKIDIQAK
jgi:HAE1 family hydrophobic/amphiphilic exporter-1